MALKQLLTLHWEYELAFCREADRHTATGWYIFGLFGENVSVFFRHTGSIGRYFNSVLIGRLRSRAACGYFHFRMVIRSILSPSCRWYERAIFLAHILARGRTLALVWSLIGADVGRRSEPMQAHIATPYQ
jgi:hypothetical protein